MNEAVKNQKELIRKKLYPEDPKANINCWPEDARWLLTRLDLVELELTLVLAKVNRGDNMDYTSQSTGNYGYTKMIGVPICPDLLSYSDIGEADNLRGRIVRGFFYIMRWWPS